MKVGRWAPLVIAATLLALVVGVATTGGRELDSDLDRAIEIQEEHTDLLDNPGVVGTAVGLDAAGEAVIKIYAQDEGIEGLPEDLDGVSVELEVTRVITALACPPPTNRCARPVPIGVSTGHPAITAGTIGARVKDASGNVYALSNNHVYAASNGAAVGDNVLQPGPVDGGTAGDAIGTLYDYEPIAFGNESACILDVANCNTMDAAVALSSQLDLGNTTLPSPYGYGTPGSTTVAPSIGLEVQKSGRTTGLTTGVVTGINGFFNVFYGSPGVATFAGQIVIEPPAGGEDGENSFSAGGDSGSLVVARNPSSPVGLLFAGSDSFTIANPIDLVLNRFDVSIDGEGAPGPTATATTGLPTVTPTVTPTATPTATATATNTPLPPTATATATNTPLPPTATPTNTPTATNTPVPPTATPTNTPTATNTPVPPTATATATNTPLPPTATPTNTPTATTTVTNTPLSPTATETTTPTATNTPVPPTATNTPTAPPEGGDCNNCQGENSTQGSSYTSPAAAVARFILRVVEMVKAVLTSLSW